MKKSLLLILTLLSTACATHHHDDDLGLEPVSLFERRSAEAIATDRDIEIESSEELNDDETLQGQAHINVSAYNGAVLVTGEAATADIRNKIISLIRVVDNVKRVYNNVAIAYPSDGDSRANDALITEKVTTALAQIRTLPNFDSSQVEVVTENAVVYLMGLVHRAEGAVVINVTRHQPDVKQIITVFEYLD